MGVEFNLSEKLDDEEKKFINRLCINASNVIKMLKNVFTGKNGTNMYLVTIYAAGLAGIACHEAVKVLGKQQVIIDTISGKKYYIGDEVNKFLYENKFSVTSMISSITLVSKEKILNILSRQLETIGSEKFIINGNMDPNDLYINIKNCWDGIFKNMTNVYCKSPEEWPVFFAIILQNVIRETLPYVPKEEIFNTVTDIVCALSKMDKEYL